MAAPAAGAPDIPGYRIDAPIGRGGFATVYAGHQDAVGGRVAIKVLHHADPDADALLRFRREARAMGALRGHPHIVTVLDAGVAADGRPYLVMELVETGSLHAELVRRARAGEGPLPVERVLAIGVAVASALATAHAAGILHRDLKPGNVLLDEYGEPLLTDFGIARLADHEASVGGPVVSAGFSAPEVVRGAEPTVASDVFAFGCTLYALLAGRSPFRRPGDAGVLAALTRTVEEPAPDLRGAGVPEPLWAVLERCLAKDPADRYADMAEVARALQRVEGDLGLPETTAPLPAAPGVDGVDAREPETALVDVAAALGGVAGGGGADVGGAVVGATADAVAEPRVAAPPARRWSTPVVVGAAFAAVAVAGAAGALAAGLLRGPSLAEQQAASDAANPPVYGPADVDVEVVTPYADALAELYGAWGEDINDGQMEDAYEHYAAAGQAALSFAAFDEAFGPLVIRSFVVQDAAATAEGADVRVTYRSTGFDGAGRFDLDCMAHEERHRLTGDRTALRIAATEEVRPPEPC